MPSRYIVKEFASDSYYHVFNRGVNKQIIFSDDIDRYKFISIVQRHLDPKNKAIKSDGLTYKKFNGSLELLCYCLMDNHFHLLLHQKDSERSIADFMTSICTAYVMYFNRRHHRIGSLFQGIYKASRISDDSYLLHISRYIHMNPSNYKNHKWSSLSYYLGAPPPNWLHPGVILSLFGGGDYIKFLEDYEQEKELLGHVKEELADQ